MEKTGKEKLLPLKAIVFLFSITLSALTRLLWLDRTALFINDQGRDMLVLYNFVFNKKLTLIGPATSVASHFGNVYFGPFYYYFLLPFYTVNNSPIFMTAIFPVLFLVGLIIFLKLNIKEKEKLLFLILVTFSATSLYYTRFLWNLNLGLLLSFILFGIYFLFDKKIINFPILSFVFGLISGAVFQMHYAMFFLYASFFYLFLKNKKALATASLGFVLSFLPFLVFDLRHDFVVAKGILDTAASFLQVKNMGNAPSLNVFEKVFDYYLFPGITIPSTVKTVTGALSYLGVMVYLFKNKTKLNSFLLLSFTVFLLTFAAYKREYDYYLACFFPWYYLGLALTVASIMSIRKIFFVSLSIFIIMFVVINTQNYWRLKDNVYSIAKQKTLAQVIASDAEKEGIKEISLRVIPHKDDHRGLSYILLTRYGLKTKASDEVDYYICLITDCRIKEATLLYKEKELFLYKSR
jgi:hypothetical protein